jgi:hypothetical protein
LNVVARASPIRDMIGSFLSEPRAARDVAEHIERPVPVATGHLASMCRLGLARRIGQNAYVAAGYSGPPVQFPYKRTTELNALRRQIRPLLSKRVNSAGIWHKTGASIDDIRGALREMWLSGDVIGDDQAGYILKEASR